MESKEYCGGELKEMIMQMNALLRNLEELNKFAFEMAKGNLDIDIPPRDNYIAGPLKQLHSQLVVLSFSMKQLSKGYMVSKFEYGGELFENFNEIIDNISEKSIKNTENSNSDYSINSWRYHQILKTLDMIHIMVVETDGNGNIVYYNNAAKIVLGNIKNINFDKTESKILKAVLTNQYNSKFPVIRDIYEEKVSLWYRITTDCFTFANGQEFYFNVIEDITQWKINEAKLKQKNLIDDMTGTLNRRYGILELKQTLADIDIKDNNCLSFMDIDGLKIINDEYGHAEGDYAIKNISNIFLTSVRESDIVCRYGGDEFFIIFKNCSYKKANDIIERMYKKLKAKNYSICKPYELSFSYGLVSFSSGSGTAKDILNAADEKMYIHKNAKKRDVRECDDKGEK